MIRAYGDRAFFQRFKWRFIFAPIFLVSSADLFFLWTSRHCADRLYLGVWHGMIANVWVYVASTNAKVGSFAALTRRLDSHYAGSGLQQRFLLSPQRMSDTLEVIIGRADFSFHRHSSERQSKAR